MVVGFVFAKLLSGKKEGDIGIVPSLRFSYKQYIIHIHHWIWGCLLLLVLFALDYYSDFIYGFLIGLIIQGLTYRDFYKVIYKKG